MSIFEEMTLPELHSHLIYWQEHHTSDNGFIPSSAAQMIHMLEDLIAKKETETGLV